MATNTYIALDKVTVGTATPSITFTSIPGTYTDLVIVASCGSASGQAFLMRFNGDTGSNYSEVAVLGSGSAASSYQDGNTTFAEIGGIWNSQGTTIINVMNYANTSVYKTSLTRNSDASFRAQATANLWRSTAAITSITLFPNSGVNFNVGSTFELYGILAEGVSPTTKATGGAVYSDSTYYYHVFGASGTFTPTQSITADVLVVAGGGSGGQSYGGGGGAGGLLAHTSQSLTATGYTVTVGAGGPATNASSGADIQGNNGSNSQFASLTASVGGGGGGGDYGNIAYSGKSGGSGGGGPSAGGGPGSGGSGTAGQGNSGSSGIGSYGVNSSGGGGGGAGAAPVSTGIGGVGSSAYSTWVLATGVGQVVGGIGYIAGGGGGQHYYPNSYNYGGYGGGGQGSGGYSSGNPRAENGTANTGGGGGGEGAGYGKGGSGVVIVRYAK